jgi:CRP-like cAMP-binding protein
VHKDLEAMLEDGPVVEAETLLSRTPSGFDAGFSDEAHLVAGCSFGELAIMHDRPRNATIKCISRCHFLTLSRKDYIETLNEIIKRQQNDQINFLKNIPVFAKLSRTYMTNKLIQFIKQKDDKDRKAAQTVRD